MRREPDVQNAIEAVLSFDPQCGARGTSNPSRTSSRTCSRWTGTIITVARGDEAHVVASTTKPFRELVRIRGLVGERIPTTHQPVIVEDAQRGTPGRVPEGFAAFPGLPLQRAATS